MLEKFNSFIQKYGYESAFVGLSVVSLFSLYLVDISSDYLLGVESWIFTFFLSLVLLLLFAHLDTEVRKTKYSFTYFLFIPLALIPLMIIYAFMEISQYFVVLVFALIILQLILSPMRKGNFRVTVLVIAFAILIPVILFNLNPNTDLFLEFKFALLIADILIILTVPIVALLFCKYKKV